MIGYEPPEPASGIPSKMLPDELMLAMGSATVGADGNKAVQRSGEKGIDWRT